MRTTSAYFAAVTLGALASLSNPVFAAENAPVSTGGGVIQIATALLLVLGLVVMAAWLMRRLGPMMSVGNKIPVKIIGGVNVGSRERVMVVEIADQWLVLGVTASNINTLASMPKQEELLNQSAQTTANDPFSAWLKRTLEKRTTERSAEQSENR
ncbi:hypothetical protein UNDKW_2228 [Undibacterium sp. KW1]|uniref:flagellar biosynthetic protein FliO n=1 Tax=Undibacterium sp. KW1 TaxID=2058624 RepID=UPI001331E9BE|nr:flagellar biosynthetic protein FliO [Undibacterium sp. KW1]BBB60501.1 hypothetical protein UNDKW_2228 [Undibacterium sp. KW1]